MSLSTLFHTIVDTLVNSISSLGYVGIGLLMAIESSFVPFPSEIILIPAGILIHNGEMSFFLVLIAAVVGSLLGALFNYYLALKLGRKVIERLISKYGSFFLLSSASLKKSEIFFQKHGKITTLTGRLIPVIRQLISLPAGFSKMNLFSFTLYTGIGASIWSIVLIFIGIKFGENQELIEQNLSLVTLVILLLVSIIILSYVIVIKLKKRKFS